MKNTFGKTKGEYIRKVTLAGQEVYMIDISSEQGKLVVELVNKIKNNESVGISKIEVSDTPPSIH